MTTTTAHRPVRRSGRVCRCAACSISSPRSTLAIGRGRSSACSTSTCCATSASPRPTAIWRSGAPSPGEPSAERVARQLLVDRGLAAEMRAVEAEVPHLEPRRRVGAACHDRLLQPHPVGKPLRQAGEGDVRHETAAGQRDAGAARGGLDLGLEAGEGGVGGGADIDHPRAGAAEEVDAGERQLEAGATIARKAVSTSSSRSPGISPRKTRVRCRFSGGTVRGTGRPCCRIIRSNCTGLGSARAAKARITGRGPASRASGPESPCPRRWRRRRRRWDAGRRTGRGP